MKITFTALLIVANIAQSILVAQSLHIGFGPIFTHTNAITPIVNGKEDFQNTDFSLNFGYEHRIKKRASIFGSYTNYDGCTLLLFERGGWIGRDGGEIFGYGFCAGVKVHRVDFGINYSLLNTKRKFYLKPSVLLCLQKTRMTGIGFWDDAEPINGPNYFELEPMSAIPMNTTQIAPSIGFKTGFVFWKRLDVGLTIQGVYAFKPYQKMYLKYQYKGTDQPMAEYESTGTGLFVSLGVGYRFARLIE